MEKDLRGRVFQSLAISFYKKSLKHLIIYLKYFIEFAHLPSL